MGVIQGLRFFQFRVTNHQGYFFVGPDTKDDSILGSLLKLSNGKEHGTCNVGWAIVIFMKWLIANPKP